MSRGRSSKTLERIILAHVIVPILVLITREANTKLDFTSHLAFKAANVNVENELVGEPVARARHVGRVNVGGAGPLVQGVPDEHGLVEVQIHHSDDAFDGGQVAHVCTFQTHFSVPKLVEKVRTTTGLRK